MTASLNPYISAFDEGFDVEKSSQYRMTIQFSLGGFSYALLDATKRTLIGLECYQSDQLTETEEMFRALEKALDSKGLTNKPLLSVTCLIDDRINTFVPMDLFDESKKNDYLEFLFQTSSGQVILNETLEREKCVNVYALPKSLHTRIISKWDKAKITHSSTIFIDNAIRYAPEGKVAFVNVKSRSFDLAIIDEGRMVFFNNFRFNSKDDFAYFLIFALEQNHLSTLKHPVCFSGFILPLSEIVELCSRYIKYLIFIEDRKELQVSEALSEVPFQYYHLHYQTLRCES
jgi:hypothetical protein